MEQVTIPPKIQQTIEEIKRRKREKAEEILAKTREIRRKITAATGEWDAVETIRAIRHATK